MRKIKERLWSGFFAGIAFISAIESIQKDIMGKEKYIQMAEMRWIDSSISIPLAIFILIIVGIIMYIENIE